jgi:choice-of-anchor A domain-containing protein
MDTRLRRALVRILGAAVVVMGVFVTATAVRRADQVIASGRDVLLGGQLVDLFSARDLVIDGHAELAGTAVALGDLAVRDGTLRVEREATRTFAVGGAVEVADSAAVVFPESGGLKYGTIRSGAAGSRDTVLRDPHAVAEYAELTPSLESSSVCFARTPTTGIVRVEDDGLTLIGDGASGLQVFHVDRELAGVIRVRRVPSAATVLVNVVGRDALVAPAGREWNAVAEHLLVNVPDAATVVVDGGSGAGLHVLVGSSEGEVQVVGDTIRGSVLSLAQVTVTNTRIEHGPLTAPMLPECAPSFDPVDEPEVSTPAVAPSTTTTSTTTTTTVAPGEQPRGSRAVPGAAFALGGAATASKWWAGIPLSLLGGVLLGWNWIAERRRQRQAWLERRKVTVRVLHRAGLRDRV